MKIRSAGLFATVSAATMLLAGVAQAQDTAASAAVEEVIVTGSRLATGFSAPTPVTVLGAAQLEARAATTVYDLTRDIPVFRNTSGPNNNTLGFRTGGQALLDLRGLTPVRTLTLVDGVRPGGTNSTLVFDTNSLPATMIERTEIVTGGASAAYGSDAVAGVVNLILKKRMDGISGTVQAGQSIHNDNKETLFSLGFGKSFMDDKLHLVIGGDFNENKGMGTIYSREWGRREPGLFALPATRAAGLPSQIFSDYVEMSNNSVGGVINSGPLKGTAFDLNGNPYQLPIGPIAGATEMYSPTQASYGNSEHGANELKYPYKRFAAAARVEYEITPDMKAYAFLNYATLNQVGGETIGFSPTNVIINRDNPYLPASVLAAMTAQNLQSITISKLVSMNSEFPGWTNGNKLDQTNFVTGIDGKITEGWAWNANYQYGIVHRHQQFLSTPKAANYYASVYAVRNANGTIACGPSATNPNFTTANPTARTAYLQNLESGCVPYNPFGTRNASPEALRYIQGTAQTDETLKQQSLQGNITGEPFELPAGKVSVAFGGEYRHYDDDSVAGYNSAPLYLVNENAVSYAAKIKVKEFYGEVGVPLLKDLPFIQALDVNGAARRTDYSTSGGVTTWKVGGTWEVNDMVRLRATRSRDIRAPNFNELYQSGVTGTATIINRAAGVSGLIRTIRNANPDLTPEIADTFTAGIVFQPKWEWAWGARLSVDMYRIDIKDVIAAIPDQELSDRYFVFKLTEYARFFDLDNSPIGFSAFRTQPFNLNNLKTNGVDVEFSVRPPIEAIGIPGRFDIRALGTFVDDLRTISPLPDGTRRDDDTAGQFVPEWSWNVAFNYALNRFSTSINAKYTTPIKYSTAFVGPNDPNYNPASNNSINKNLFPEALYWHVNTSYDLIQAEGRRLQLFGVVENLFDKKPPLVATLIIRGGNPYDVIGRNIKLGMRFSF